MTGGGDAGEKPGDHDAGSRKRTPGSVGGRPFISYVAVHNDDVEADPDGLDHKARMALEEKAIQFILASDSKLQPTLAGNSGFDLFEAGANDEEIRWIEVKSMTGGLSDRPVGLSHTQFECARQHGKAYWIYVVEHANSADEMRIVRIQDPAGEARTFTFDRGWLDYAEMNAAQEDRAD